MLAVVACSVVLIITGVTTLRSVRTSQQLARPSSITAGFVRAASETTFAIVSPDYSEQREFTWARHGALRVPDIDGVFRSVPQRELHVGEYVEIVLEEREGVALRVDRLTQPGQLSGVVEQ